MVLEFVPKNGGVEDGVGGCWGYRYESNGEMELGKECLNDHFSPSFVRG